MPGGPWELDDIYFDPKLLEDVADASVLRTHGRDKSYKAAVNNIYNAVLLYGIDHVLFHTYTYDIDPSDNMFFCVRLATLFIEKYISPRYGGRYVRVLERGEKGFRLHFHMLTYVPWDTEYESFPWHETGGGPAGDLPEGQKPYYGNVPARMYEEILWQKALCSGPNKNEFHIGYSQVRPLWVPKMKIKKVIPGSPLSKLNAVEQVAYITALYTAKYMCKETIIKVADKRKHRENYKKNERQYHKILKDLTTINVYLTRFSDTTKKKTGTPEDNPEIKAMFLRKRELTHTLYFSGTPLETAKKDSLRAEVATIDATLKRAPSYLRTVFRRRELLHSYRYPGLHAHRHAQALHEASVALLHAAGVKIPDTASKLKKETAAVCMQAYAGTVAFAKSLGFSFSPAFKNVQNRHQRLASALAFLHKVHSQLGTSPFYETLRRFVVCRKKAAKKPLARFRAVKAFTKGQSWGWDEDGNCMRELWSPHYMDLGGVRDGEPFGGMSLRYRRKVFMGLSIKAAGLDWDVDTCDMPELRAIWGNRKADYQLYGLIVGVGSVTEPFVLEYLKEKFQKWNTPAEIVQEFLNFCFENMKDGKKAKSERDACFEFLMSEPEPTADVYTKFREALAVGDTEKKDTRTLPSRAKATALRVLETPVLPVPTPIPPPLPLPDSLEERIRLLPFC